VKTQLFDFFCLNHLEKRFGLVDSGPTDMASSEEKEQIRKQSIYMHISSVLQLERTG
jgi:hypothetical protein